LQKIQLGEKQIRQNKEKKNKDYQLLALIEVQKLLKDMGYKLEYDLSEEKHFAVYKSKINKMKMKNNIGGEEVGT
jgi:hypothetical protein